MYERMKYVERRASQFLSVHFLSINGQYVYKATPRFHFRKKTAWEMGKEKWSYTQKWSEAGKEFPILCEDKVQSE